MNTEDFPIFSIVYSSLVVIVDLVVIGALIGIYTHITWIKHKYIKLRSEFSTFPESRNTHC